jgi:uncharacterized coiled-coil protein SlyX
MEKSVLVVESAQKLAWNNEQVVLKNEDVTVILHVHTQELHGQFHKGQEVDDLMIIASPDEVSATFESQIAEKNDTIVALTNQVNNYDTEVKNLQSTLSDLHDELATTRSSKESTISILEGKIAELTAKIPVQ